MAPGGSLGALGGGSVALGGGLVAQWWLVWSFYGGCLMLERIRM